MDNSPLIHLKSSVSLVTTPETPLRSSTHAFHDGYQAAEFVGPSLKLCAPIPTDHIYRGNVGEVAQKESGAAPDPEDDSPRFYFRSPRFEAGLRVEHRVEARGDPLKTR